VTAFPVSPPAAGEQLALPLEGTLAGRYAAWRQTADGLRVFLEIERRVLARANSGSREHPIERIEVNHIWSSVRAELKVKANNDFRAPAARELIARAPWLKAVIEIRRQRSP
jgi:hypothetical protein